ncbi:MAG: glycoside hydrolase family 15 protein [Actinobacteria bacterium]|nr:glycoside hydrolase family 15 protein [Actinomycetota bacterium]MBV8958124.1 glycoside hydrolase family 15 protein [Actinomycetota bacterium]MBV9255958.1 glycoside hydrolase family 15 protein [Actinomycetota bacterium]MBV9665052.1 glycoside hydrolase family 15 protein [Actinomycetota bacterium]MBV9933575.1 glycoside hydrolase family 15 protein [Actinomycetota bacterium]
MSTPIEDYALIGDTHTAALVSKTGSIDWLCLPRFDGGACFAALLGDESHGHWQIAPAGGVKRVTRRYRGETLVLETEFVTEEGTVRVVDCMSPRVEYPEVVRVVEGVRGRVPMRMELVVRYDYGSIVPWVRRVDGDLMMVAGPESLWLRSGVRPHGENLTTVAEFSVSEGQHVPFVLTWCPSTEPPPRAIDATHAVREIEQWWTRWAEQCEFPRDSPYRPIVLRSLETLKALTYAPTGGIVAAATTSLPEHLGGVRNWDYRFCWLRDATFTLWALLGAGYVEEAAAWRDWLLRAVAGDPAALQIMYGPAGERRLFEMEVPWLPGYEDSSPVRIGNAAFGQFQLDVYGEVLDAMHQARGAGIVPDEAAWNLERALVGFVEGAWTRPDEGIWEVRGPRRHFTHSKVMAWVAVDRAVKAVERFGNDGPVDEWRRLRDAIHADVCKNGYDANRNSFTQYYGSDQLDASLLMMPLVGFLPATDERVKGTVAAIERDLTRDGFVLRYHEASSAEVDGLPPGEGVFLACTFWMADNLIMQGRTDEARTLFERLVGLTNDVGLLSEEYDPVANRLVGNFPQAFSHVSLVNTARNLAASDGRAAMAARAAEDDAAPPAESGLAGP